MNTQQYSNPQVLEQGKSIFDWEERVEFHEEVEKIVMEDAALGWAVEPNYVIAMRDNIKGWHQGLVDETLWRYVYFAE